MQTIHLATELPERSMSGHFVKQSQKKNPQKRSGKIC